MRRRRGATVPCHYDRRAGRLSPAVALRAAAPLFAHAVASRAHRSPPHHQQGPEARWRRHDCRSSAEVPRSPGQRADERTVDQDNDRLRCHRRSLASWCQLEPLASYRCSCRKAIIANSPASIARPAPTVKIVSTAPKCIPSNRASKSPKNGTVESPGNQHRDRGGQGEPGHEHGKGAPHHLARRHRKDDWTKHNTDGGIGDALCCERHHTGEKRRLRACIDQEEQTRQQQPTSRSSARARSG